MRKLVLLLALGFGTLLSHAQTASTKIGYADVDYIFSQLPEAKQIDTELKSTQTQLKNQIDTKYADFQKKLADYQANLNTMLDAVRQNTERELQQMQQNIEKLQQDAQTTIQAKQTQLMDPVYKKVGKGIEEVAKENGFSFILNQQIGGLDVILYGDEKMDISDLVLKKLGVTPKPITPTTEAK
ncbi:MAG: OmpH family outer membrane protein [Cyclobacteriaceae bacterium]|jgi:outer membrane protein|nr:OmpH family outer membrane protein [Cyclobacteriaceae bacterium]MDH4294854.1 OmpH family outer membrane protein [Cyclobacteriaceae bacterium]MDH5247355.1 OmpH family outer membrane protein [Cyclobacteriaceae bacterium]